MFKVICVQLEDAETPDSYLIQAAKELRVGEIYTVVNESRKGYKLAEFIHPRGIWWLKKSFISLSSIDETEMEHHYKNETV